MTLSKELQIGKAAEHLVCANLILQGCNAFLADQGLPYDVVVDTSEGLKRVQVKSTSGLANFRDKYQVYRFGLRRAKGNTRKVDSGESDFYAFVALDIMKIAYVPIHLLLGTDKTSVLQCLEFRSKCQPRHPNNSIKGSPRNIRYFEDYEKFPLGHASYSGFKPSSNNIQATPLSLWRNTESEVPA